MLFDNWPTTRGLQKPSPQPPNRAAEPAKLLPGVLMTQPHVTQVEDIHVCVIGQYLRCLAVWPWQPPMLWQDKPVSVRSLTLVIECCIEYCSPSSTAARNTKKADIHLGGLELCLGGLSPSPPSPGLAVSLLPVSRRYCCRCHTGIVCKYSMCLWLALIVCVASLTFVITSIQSWLDNDIHNPVQCKSNYNSTSNHTVHWPSMDTAWRWLGGAASRPDPSSLYQI